MGLPDLRLMEEVAALIPPDKEPELKLQALLDRALEVGSLQELRLR